MKIIRLNFFCKIILVISVLLISNISFGQTKVAFLTEHIRDICSMNNDVLKANQLCILKIEGPETGSWFFSYSIDGGAEIIANENNPIDKSVYPLRISIKNTTKKNKNFSVVIKRAWLEGDVSLEIDKYHYEKMIPVLSLTEISIDDYVPMVKIGSTHDYVFTMAIDSDYNLVIPPECQLIDEIVTYQDVDMIVRVRIKWPNKVGLYSFSIQEFNVLDCSGDKYKIELDCMENVSVKLNPIYSACQGEDVVLKPIYDITVKDFKFSWNTGETTPNITVSEEGVYTVQVSSVSEGITKSLKTKFVFNQIPDVTLKSIYIKEDKDVLNLSFTDTDYSFEWSNGETSQSVKLANSGLYKLDITSKEGCVNSKSFRIRNTSELFTIDLASELTMCKGDTFTIIPKKSIIQNYTYSWNTGSDKSSILVSKEGVYTVSVTDALNYTQTATINVIIEAPFDISSIQDEYILDKDEIIAVAVEGNDLTYKWSTGETRPSINISKKGDYFVEVRSKLDCLTRKDFKVWDQSDFFSITADAVKHVCEGSEYMLSASTSIEQVYSYLWSTGETSKEIIINSPGVYNVEVKDVNGFKQTKDIKLIVHEYPIISNLKKYYVLEESSELIIDMPDNDMLYKWSTGAKTSSVTINTAGNYYLEVSNKYSCKTKQNFLVKDASDFFTMSMPGQIDACANNKVKLTPILNIDQNYSFLWSNGSKEKYIDIEESGTYTLTVKDDFGYSQQKTTILTIHPLPIVDLGSDKILWGSETITIDAGAGAEKYEWSTGGTDQTISVTESGEYSVDVTSKYGCESNGDINLVINKGTRFQIALDVFSSPDRELQEITDGIYSLCEGDSLLLKAVVSSGEISGNAKYSWLGFDGIDEDHVYVKNSGVYSLSVYDEFLNEMKAEVNIEVYPYPELNIGKDIINSKSNSVTLNAPTTNVIYEWSTGEISQFISVTEGGTYSVIITNENGCSNEDEINVSFFGGYPFVGLPNVFSPNGDGLNDKIKIIGSGYKNVELSVYNRLGVQVFHTTDPDGAWDGRYKGVMQDSDNYVYVLKIIREDDFVEIKSGGFILIH